MAVNKYKYVKYREDDYDYLLSLMAVLQKKTPRLLKINRTLLDGLEKMVKE